jgi:hypothetical protein
MHWTKLVSTRYSHLVFQLSSIIMEHRLNFNLYSSIDPTQSEDGDSRFQAFLNKVLRRLLSSCYPLMGAEGSI